MKRYIFNIIGIIIISIVCSLLILTVKIYINDIQFSDIIYIKEKQRDSINTTIILQNKELDYWLDNSIPEFTCKIHSIADTTITFGDSK